MCKLLTANVSAFYYDYQNLQVYTLIVDPTTNLTVQNFTNASNAGVWISPCGVPSLPRRANVPASFFSTSNEKLTLPVYQEKTQAHPTRHTT